MFRSQLPTVELSPSIGSGRCQDISVLHSIYVVDYAIGSKHKNAISWPHVILLKQVVVVSVQAWIIEEVKSTPIADAFSHLSPLY